jgi:CheY-like chemotaxis protein
VTVKRAGSNLQICVSDSGLGITPAFLPYIFEHFRQADGTTTRLHGGLGLGLAIVRQIVELHGGLIRAESPGEGLGSTFTIQLPLAPSTQRKRGRRSPVGLQVEASPAPATSPTSLADVKVLLVDDDVDTLQILSVLLTDCKAQVQTATSVAAGLEALEWFDPDVLVSDLAMPGEDGYALIRKLRESVIDSAQIPAVALTSYVRVEDRARALSAGFNMFVAKPVQPDELIAAIANLAETEE